MNKKGFTLAETLITLAIIGIISAMTMPIMAKVQDIAKERRIENIQENISSATALLQISNKLSNHSSTMAFVEVLRDHLKIAKICDNSHLEDCWPTDKILIGDNGEEWDIKSTKKGKNFKMPSDDNNDWDDTVGIITIDGTHMILSYNKKCSLTSNKMPSWSGNRSSSSSCIAGIYDWNGAKKPNKFNMADARSDVLAFNANGLGGACAIEAGGVCFGAPFKPTPVDGDYWLGAVQQCGGQDKIPSSGELKKLETLLYEGEFTMSFDSRYIPGSATALGLPEPIFAIWTDDEVSSIRAVSLYFYNWGTGTNNEDGDYDKRTSGTPLALCKG